MEGRSSSSIGTEERVVIGANGWVGLFVLLALLACAGFAFLFLPPLMKIAGLLLGVVTIFCTKGLFTLEPNQAAVLLLRQVRRSARDGASGRARASHRRGTRQRL